MNIPNKNELTRIYGEAEKSAARFQAVADHFAEFTIMIQQNFYSTGKNRDHRKPYRS